MLTNISAINFQKNLRVSYFLMLVTFKNNSENKFRVFADLCVMFSRFGLLIWLYHYLFLYVGDTIKGENYQTIVWSMFFYFSFLSVNPRYLSRAIETDVKSGNIEILFSKPINYILYKFSHYIGSRLFFFIINLVLGTFTLVLLIGVPSTILTFTFLFTILPTLIFCFTLSFLICTALGLCAFWIEDVGPLQWIIDKLVMILGGSYLPVAFFPPVMKTLAIWSPFGASQFLSHMVYASWATDFWKLLLIQILWISIFGIVVYFLFDKAIKNASVNGG